MNLDIPKQIIDRTRNPGTGVYIDLKENLITLYGSAARRAVDLVLADAVPTNSESAPGGVRGLVVLDFDSRSATLPGRTDHTRHVINPEGEDIVTIRLAT